MISSGLYFFLWVSLILGGAITLFMSYGNNRSDESENKTTLETTERVKIIIGWILVFTGLVGLGLIADY